jgi:hypothetical protein
MAKIMETREAGKVISSINRNELLAAWKAFKNVFTRAGINPDEGEEEEETEAKEAALSVANKTERIMRVLKANTPGLQYPYTIDDKGAVSFGTSKEVLGRSAYETLDGDSLTDTISDPAEASTSEAELIDLTSDMIPLTEAASTANHSIPIKIIAPGKGSSGYYPPEVLKRDGPKVFKRGLPMYWNHDSPAQEAERPEGDMDRLAAVLTEDASWNDSGPEGAGLYSRMKVFGDYAEKVKEKAPFTGLSIRAGGRARMGEVAGLGKLPVIESIVQAKSVDFVTRAGAGGKVVSLQESATDNTGEDSTMADQPQITQLEEIIKTQGEALKRLTEAMERSKAEPMIDQGLRGFGLPAHAVAKLRPMLIGAVKLTEAGALDAEALSASIKEAATAEASYLASLGVGSVQGMGGAGDREFSEADVEATQKRIAEKLQSFAK